MNMNLPQTILEYSFPIENVEMVNHKLGKWIFFGNIFNLADLTGAQVGGCLKFYRIAAGINL